MSRGFLGLDALLLLLHEAAAGLPVPGDARHLPAPHHGGGGRQGGAGAPAQERDGDAVPVDEGEKGSQHGQKEDGHVAVPEHVDAIRPQVSYVQPVTLFKNLLREC